MVMKLLMMAATMLKLLRTRVGMEAVLLFHVVDVS